MTKTGFTVFGLYLFAALVVIVVHLGMGDYVFAAPDWHLDIIKLFLRILRMLGERRETLKLWT